MTTLQPARRMSDERPSCIYGSIVGDGPSPAGQARRSACRAVTFLRRSTRRHWRRIHRRLLRVRSSARDDCARTGRPLMAPEEVGACLPACRCSDSPLLHLQPRKYAGRAPAASCYNVCLVHFAKIFCKGILVI